MAESTEPGSQLRRQVRLLSLPTKQPLAAAHDRDPSADRQLVILSVDDADGAAGWGECSALNSSGYTDEYAAGAFDLLASGASFDAARHPMAAAAVEMAALDLDLRRAGRSLADHLGVNRQTVTGGATIGLHDRPTTLDRVEAAVAAGYRRVKLKVAAGDVAPRIAAVHQRFPDLEIQVDANGSLGRADLDDLLSLVELGVTAIEQPFPADQPALAAELLALVSIPVVADEAVADLGQAEELLRQGALGGLSVKPPRLGGIGPAVAAVRWCVANDIPAVAGGMLESGLGRNALAAVAGLDGFSLTGDLTPAGYWVAADPFPDVGFENGTITIHRGPGVGPEPDLDLLDRLTVRRSTV